MDGQKAIDPLENNEVITLHFSSFLTQKRCEKLAEKAHKAGKNAIQAPIRWLKYTTDVPSIRAT